MSYPVVCKSLRDSNIEISQVQRVDSRSIWCLDKQGALHLLDAFDGTVRRSITFPSEHTTQYGLPMGLRVHVHPNGAKRLYVSCRRGHVLVFDAAEAAVVKVLAVIMPPTPTKTSSSESAVIGMTTLNSSDAGALLYVAYEKEVHVISILGPNGGESRPEEHVVFEERITSIECTEQGGSGHILYVGTADGLVHEVKQGKKRQTFCPTVGAASTVHASPAAVTQARFISGRLWCLADGAVHVYDLALDMRSHVLDDLRQSCASLVVCGNEVIAVGDGGNAVSYHAASVKRLHEVSSSHCEVVGGISTVALLGPMTVQSFCTVGTKGDVSLWLHKPNAPIGGKDAVVGGVDMYEKVLELNDIVLSYEQELANSRTVEDSQRREIDQLMGMLETQKKVIEELEAASKHSKPSASRELQLAADVPIQSLLSKETDALAVQLEMAKTNLHRQAISLNEKAAAIQLQQGVIEEMKVMAKQHVDAILELQDEMEALRQELIRLLEVETEHDRIKIQLEGTEEELELTTRALEDESKASRGLEDHLVEAKKSIEALHEELEEQQKRALGMQELYESGRDLEFELTTENEELNRRVEIQQSLLEEKISSIELLRQIVESKESNIEELEEQMEELLNELNGKVLNDAEVQCDGKTVSDASVGISVKCTTNATNTDLTRGDFSVTIMSQQRAQGTQLDETEFRPPKQYKAADAQCEILTGKAKTFSVATVGEVKRKIVTSESCMQTPSKSEASAKTQTDLPRSSAVSSTQTEVPTPTTSHAAAAVVLEVGTPRQNKKRSAAAPTNITAASFSQQAEGFAPDFTQEQPSVEDQATQQRRVFSVSGAGQTAAKLIDSPRSHER
eukprot:PhM_4_TR8794/c0_g1_i3/m.102328